MNGRKLKELRDKHGYSREKFAQLLYVTPSIIESWEEGWAIINPSSGEIDEMAQLFSMTEEMLRTVLNLDEEDDYDCPTNQTKFIDYVDSVINCISRKKGKK